VSSTTDPGAAAASGVVIAVVRGGCEVVTAHGLRELRLTGRHAHEDLRLAVGDEITFDPAGGTVLERGPRRTRLARCRPLGRRREVKSSDEQVIAVNMDRLAIVVAVKAPPFRAGAVDRFMLAAAAGGLEAILVVNKIDLLEGGPLPRDIAEYEGQMPVYRVCAHGGAGIPELRAALVRSRTVLAGHSGVGKSSLLNALAPGAALQTGDLRKRDQRGSHTTSRAHWIEIDEQAVIVDTPGVREIASGPIDPELLSEVFPDIRELAQGCRFGDCHHGREPQCAVRDALEQGELAPARLARYGRLRADIETSPSRGGRADRR
jgi:ribosome biogenesis GTPase